MNSSDLTSSSPGPVGTGKGTLVRQMVKRLAQTAPSPPIGVTSTIFRMRPGPPVCFRRDRGPFKREMGAFIEGLRRDIPAAFEGKNTSTRRRRSSRTRKEEKIALSRTHDTLSPAGFWFEETPVGSGSSRSKTTAR